MDRICAGYAYRLVFGLANYARWVQSIIKPNANMWSVIRIAAAAAYPYGVRATAAVAPDTFPASVRIDGHVSTYFEVLAVIFWLTLIGACAQRRSGNECRDLRGVWVRPQNGTTHRHGWLCSAYTPRARLYRRCSTPCARI